jgi:hypothetical protein
VKISKTKKQRISKWMSQHKIELILGSLLLIITGFGFFIEFKSSSSMNHITKPSIDSIEKKIKFENTTSQKISKTISGSAKIAHYRQGHIRNLGTRNPSPQKIAEAADRNIVLRKHETIVKDSFIHAN